MTRFAITVAKTRWAVRHIVFPPRNDDWEVLRDCCAISCIKLVVHIMHVDLWMRRIDRYMAHKSAWTRRMTLAGFGQEPDEPIFPLLCRFWALGIPTTGSCAGHIWSTTHYANLFVVVAARSSFAQAQWRRVVNAWWDYPQWGGGTQLLINAHVAEWRLLPPDSIRDGILRLQQLRALIVERLDTIGPHLIEDPMPDVGWHGPAPHVPSHIETLPAWDWVHFVRRYPQLYQDVVTARLDGWAWHQIAQDYAVTIPIARSIWQEVWDAWLAYSETHATTSPGRDD